MMEESMIILAWTGLLSQRRWTAFNTTNQVRPNLRSLRWHLQMIREHNRYTSIPIGHRHFWVVHWWQKVWGGETSTGLWQGSFGKVILQMQTDRNLGGIETNSVLPYYATLRLLYQNWKAQNSRNFTTNTSWLIKRRWKTSKGNTVEVDNQSFSPIFPSLSVIIALIIRSSERNLSSNWR